MKEYRIDFNMCGTLYVKAKDEAEARKKIEEQLGDPNASLESGNCGEGLELAARYIDLDEGVELSPAVTCWGWNPRQIERVDDGLDEDESEDE